MVIRGRFHALITRITRDTILFIVGLGGIVYETFSGGPEKPTLIVAFVGMLGLPLFIRTDEQRRQQVKKEEDTRNDIEDVNS